MTQRQAPSTQVGSRGILLEILESLSLIFNSDQKAPCQALNKSHADKQVRWPAGRAIQSPKTCQTTMFLTRQQQPHLGTHRPSRPSCAGRRKQQASCGANHHAGITLPRRSVFPALLLCVLTRFFYHLFSLQPSSPPSPIPASILQFHWCPRTIELTWIQGKQIPSRDTPGGIAARST